MIVFFVGTPGSGKSYEAVKKIIDNMRSGRMVCTNIDGMDSPECQEYIKHYLDISDLRFKQLFRFLTKDEVMKFWKTETVTTVLCQDDGSGVFKDMEVDQERLICPAGSLIVIDEAHKHYNARDWQATTSRELGDWASTHRHAGYDVVFITQSIDKVDKQVRTLTEWTYFFRKVNFLGGAVSKKYMKYSYSGDDHDGKALAKSVGTYENEYFNAYKSYSTSDAKEVGFMTHVNVLKHPIFYALPVVLGLALYMLFFKSSVGTGDVLGTKRIAERVEKSKQAAAASSAAAAPSPPSAAASSAAAAPSPPSAAAFKHSTSNSLVPVAVSEWSRYKVDGWIDDNGRVVVSFGGNTVILPRPDVQSFNRQTNTVVAKTEVYGRSNN